MNYPVKVLTSAMDGAPTISDAPGTLIATLDACLINGFGLRSIDSITRSGTVATATISAGHQRKVDEIVLIAGAGQAEYNGEARITAVTPTTFSWAVDGTPVSPATGTFTCKVAPVGDWQKALTGTNIAAYRSTAVGATGHYFRIDDSMASAANTWATLRGFTSMSDINTGVNPFPTTTQQSAGMVARKTASTGAKPWILIADGQFVYLLVAWNSATSYAAQYGQVVFGDVVSRRAADAYESIVGGEVSTTNSYPGQQACLWETVQFRYMSGSYYGVPGSFIPYLALHELRRNVGVPNVVDNAIMFGPGPYLLEGAVVASPVRGQLPGCYEGLHNGSPGTGIRLSNIPGLAGRELYTVTIPFNTTGHCYAFDITGPWR